MIYVWLDSLMHLFHRSSRWGERECCCVGIHARTDTQHHHPTAPLRQRLAMAQALHAPRPSHILLLLLSLISQLLFVFLVLLLFLLSLLSILRQCLRRPCVWVGQCHINAGHRQCLVNGGQRRRRRKRRERKTRRRMVRR